MHMIEKRMYRENKNQPKARALMHLGNETTFSIIKSKDVGGGGRTRETLNFLPIAI